MGNWGCGGAIKATEWPKLEYNDEVAKGRKLRGSGIWGPEETDVMRLNLYNRLEKVRQKRRIASLNEWQTFYEFDTGCTYMAACYMFFFIPYAYWMSRYSQSRDHWASMYQRLDGTKGEGPAFWWMQ